MPAPSRTPSRDSAGRRRGAPADRRWLPRDPFRRNLVWSGAAHLALLAGAAVGLDRGPGRDLLAPSAAFIELGMSGPNPTANLGAAARSDPAPEPEPPAPEPEPEPPAPEPEPAPPPPESRPEVARPTVEERDRMPVPDARTRRRSARPARPDSGLRGQDAAWAESARLESRRRLDTTSRPSRRTSRDNGTAATGSTGIGLGGTPGGTRFDQDFEYSFYQRQMIARIQANWQQIPVRGRATVVIRFTIFRDGAISGAEVETSSGQSLLDRAALRAVVLAEPLPRLPDSFPRDRVGVHLLFTYSQEAAGGQQEPDAGADERAEVAG